MKGPRVARRLVITVGLTIGAGATSAPSMAGAAPAPPAALAITITSPASTVAMLGGTASITALVTAGGAPQAGVPVSFAFHGRTGDAPPRGPQITDLNGTATFTYSVVNEGGIDFIDASTGNPAVYSNRVSVVWVADPSQPLPTTVAISLGPTTATPTTPTAFVTATVTAGGVPQAGVSVGFVIVSGPNVKLFPNSVVTDATGTASYSYLSSTTTGVDTVQAWIADRGGTALSNQVTVTWQLASLLPDPILVSDDPDGLPDTGASSTGLLLLATALTLAGFGLLVLARRTLRRN